MCERALKEDMKKWIACYIDLSIQKRQKTMDTKIKACTVNDDNRVIC